MNFSRENSFEIGIPKFMGVFDYGVYHYSDLFYYD